METDIQFLNRFTSIPFLFDLIKRKKLTLLNPNLWEDYNDRVTMQVYLKKSKANSIYALCFTHKRETVHHWNAFASGNSGCCIEFKAAELLSSLDKLSEVKHRKTEYLKVDALSKSEINNEYLPFIKRHPFEPEQEYRIILTSEEKQENTYDIDIELNVIKRITLSNKLPEITCKSVKTVLGEVEPSLKNKIYRSSLYKNQKWINHFSNL